MCVCDCDRSINKRALLGEQCNVLAVCALPMQEFYLQAAPSTVHTCSKNDVSLVAIGKFKSTLLV